MLRTISFSLITTLVSFSAFSQADSTKSAAPAPTLAITGSADVYYRYAFNKPPNTTTIPIPYNNLTSFTGTHDQVKLGMASVKLEHKTAKVDMVADLGFGPRAKEFSYNDDGITQAIKQLYISYSPTSWLKLTGGTWATHVGYEVLDAYANRNYSMSYMFTNGPFSHTGLRADFTAGKSGIMIGVSNPTDYREIPKGKESNKNLIAQYSYAASDNFKVFLNYVGGKDASDTKVHQYDLVINSKITSIFGVGFNGTVNQSSVKDGDDYADSKTWWGSALYLNLDPKPWFGLTLRGEYFKDKDNVKLPTTSVFATTLSANFKVDGFTFIPEFRLDNAKDEIFLKSDGTNFSKSTGSFILAAIYSF